MRIMGLDVGSKTVGVAISDELGWTAQGITTITINEANKDYGFKKVGKLITEYQVSKVVVGYPKNMNGTIGPRGEASEFYASELTRRYQVPTVLWDERLTTMAAERLLIEADVRREKRKAVIDKMAAVMILQGFLDSQKL